MFKAVFVKKDVASTLKFLTLTKRVHTDDRLYLFSDFLKNKPVKHLIGESLSARYNIHVLVVNNIIDPKALRALGFWDEPTCCDI